MENVNKNLSFEERIAFLRNCASLYESSGTSPISDAEYDDEYYELQKINPNHKFFSEVGGKFDEHIYGTKVKHSVIMGSLSKSLNIDEFLKWLKSAYSNNNQFSFVLQHKIDGLSLSLIYENGKLIRAATRGDGEIGVDVTKNAIYVKYVPENIPCKDLVEIRGECFKDKKDFYQNWHGEYKNPRNFAAGSLNQIDPVVTEERGLEFVAYEVVQKEFHKEIDKLKFLIDCQFKTLKDSTKRTKEGISLDKVSEAVKQYMDSIDRANLPYNIDGIVVKLNDINFSKSMGCTDGGRKPKANRAVKFPPAEQETVLLSIEANVGRTGSITPVAILEPVDLDGAMISRATLHNFSALDGDNAIKIGAKVIIAKKGDIIPQIIRIKENGHTKIEIPSKCPSCGEPVGWDENHVEIVCENINCLAQLNKKIEHWFKKIGVKGIGNGTISKLTDPNIINWEGRAIIESLPEMYYMLDNDRKSEHPFRKYEMLKNYFGEQTYNNLLTNIKSVKEISLDEFIEALGIGKVGRTASDIVAIAPTIEDIDNLRLEDILNITGFASIKAKGFIDGWKAIRHEIKQLLKYVNVKTKQKSSNKLDSQSFCFTGSFKSPSRGEMETMVVDNGGKICSVSKNMTALVWDGEISGSKFEKAKSLGIKIISQDDFLKLLQ
jgi:DNA ligase (NAD+)